MKKILVLFAVGAFLLASCGNAIDSKLNDMEKACKNNDFKKMDDIMEDIQHETEKMKDDGKLPTQEQTFKAQKVTLYCMQQKRKQDK